MSRGKRVLCIFLVILFAFSVLSMAATAIFFRLILPSAGSETNGLAVQYSDLNPSVYPRREVRFSSEGGTLQGYLYGEDNPNGIILLAHGMNSCADRHLPEALYFVEHGWCVFLFDATGTAASGGSSANLLLGMKLDVLSALQWLSAQPSLCEKPVVLYGHSLGAYAAVAAAAETPLVRAVVCISGFNSPMELMYFFAKERVGLLADAEYPFLFLYNWLAFGQGVGATAVESINVLDIPVFIIQGSADEILPWELTIAAHRSEITNSRAQYLLVDEPWRNGHSTVWLSAEAGKYAAETAGTLDELHGQYGNTLPESTLQGFLSAIDRQKLNETDKAFMEQLQSFFCAAVSAK